jgi:hypothetical protein
MDRLIKKLLEKNNTIYFAKNKDNIKCVSIIANDKNSYLGADEQPENALVKAVEVWEQSQR